MEKARICAFHIKQARYEFSYRAFCRSFFLFAVLVLFAVGQFLFGRVVGAALAAFAAALAVRDPREAEDFEGKGKGNPFAQFSACGKRSDKVLL